MRSVETHSEEETSEAGRAFAVELHAGDVVLIHGPLGAGKTAFVRGLAAGLGAEPESVSSPTFTILQEYAGTPTLYHADLYRLSPTETADLGLDDIAVEGVLAVEWPDRWSDAPTSAVSVTIDDRGGDDRLVVIRRDN
ncbi:MAG: tRNA (adenosine(37)-N6)-threonylcarbamoyltransferase complex ATPase subunit type 1 TsaE [Acidobacteria bacterium]|nr:tRNA (adenosine(37)-N6)-threonylcarbamoyltransferase complex ATPase subunit type 1 TsaE [Acidobacteriota bacterium]